MVQHLPPLEGITVIALEHAIAAPLATRQLAELGARVIKIERVDGGDFARHYDARARGLSSHFVWTNRSKESLTLDLKQPAGLEILNTLLNTADVFIQNLAPGATAKMGLGKQTLATRNPKLIVCDISGYGNSGPQSSRKAYDLLIQAEAGLLGITGNVEQGAKSGISIADIAAGTQAHAAILAALIQRGKTGVGSHIEISMLEAMTEWMGYPLYYSLDGATQPTRSGTDHATIYPYGCFRTGSESSSGESEIMLGIQNEREWEKFCRIILDDDSLITAPAYTSNSNRSKNRDSLRIIIEDKLKKLKAEEVIEALESCGIACAKANTLAELWQHPQLRALNRFIEVETEVGTLEALAPPGHSDSFDAAVSKVPSLGEHTRTILGELGYTDSEIEALAAARVI
ncbi:MAG TPA: CoA transferase [Gammaproteobacteria bacterium]|jgi:itaconate CoA-transferase|nr:CoA transferase [Gammaproteobacteria bacterium]